MRRNFRTHPMTVFPALVAVAFSLAFASPAAAGGGHHRDGHPGLYAAVAGLAVYGAIRHARHDRRHHGRHHGGHHRSRHHSRHSGHHGRGRHSGYYSDGGCHKVSKHGYYHGREARIGGTQCYDSYGNPYIVRGTRYVIEYY